MEAFLKYCELRGFRKDDYGVARFAQIVGNFFGGSLSIGIGPCSKLGCDNGDNGVYVVDGWEIVDRKYFEGMEQHSHDLTEMLVGIDEAQPERDRLGEDFIRAELKLASDLKVGDKVFMTLLMKSMWLALW